MQKIYIMGLLSTILSLFGCDGQKKEPKPSFEVQLGTFQNIGFSFNAGVDTSDLNRWENGHKEFEDSPYRLMYQTLGQTIEREPWTPITNECWNFDIEAIEDDGSYVDIMQNISRITKGEIVFEELQDYVNLEEEKAWVSFNCNGDNYKWDLKVDDDWTDGDLFDKVQNLAGKYGTDGSFTYFDTGGQDFVLGFSTAKELEVIRKETGLDIVLLKAKGQIY